MPDSVVDPVAPRESAGAILADSSSDVPGGFRSILAPSLDDCSRYESREAPEYFRDLHLDQIVQSITAGWQEYDLAPFYYAPLNDLDVVAYRQAVMHDLDERRLLQPIRQFAQSMRTTRMHLERATRSHYEFEKEPWFLSAADIYCFSLKQLQSDLATKEPKSSGLIAFSESLDSYLASPEFAKLATDTEQLKARMAAIRYSLVLKDSRVIVQRYDGESDYSLDVQATFEKFQRGAVRDYRSKLSGRAGMNHIQARILQCVARLHPVEFRSLEIFYAQHATFLDSTIVRFDREIQFYIAYLSYVERFRQAGLQFCYPTVSRSSKEVFSRGAFDLALAEKLLKEKTPVVPNDLSLREPERTLVVSGPNQGGKTTFARTFGQLHYLASLGCPVPGTEARLFLFDRIFCHFEREEDIQNLRGKLQDDLIRIHEILEQATGNSIVIMNEIFSSTALEDAVFLSKQVMTRISQLDVIGVWVTFLTELSTFDDKTVSMVSAVEPADPAIRTFKIERRPAEGLAYAMAVAEKHHVTYDWIKKRLNA